MWFVCVHPWIVWFRVLGVAWFRPSRYALGSLSSSWYAVGSSFGLVPLRWLRSFLGGGRVRFDLPVGQGSLGLLVIIWFVQVRRRGRWIRCGSGAPWM